MSSSFVTLSFYHQPYFSKEYSISIIEYALGSLERTFIKHTSFAFLSSSLSGIYLLSQLWEIFL